MTRVAFVVNSVTEFGAWRLLTEYLPGVSWYVCEHLPPADVGPDVVVLWSYRKFIPEAAQRNNVILFHSSDLPEGRGWAPIYRAIADGLERYTISAIRAADPVDSGDILARASFAMRPEYTAERLRDWDEEVCIRMLAQMLPRWPITGQKQREGETFYPRRWPEDNMVRLSERLGDLVPHLRACERRHPAFFEYQGVKYRITVEPETIAEFPADLRIEVS